LPETTKCVIGV